MLPALMTLEVTPALLPSTPHSPALALGAGLPSGVVALPSPALLPPHGWLSVMPRL